MVTTKSYTFSNVRDVHTISAEFELDTPPPPEGAVTYTFYDVNANHTIHAEFELENPEPTPQPIPLDYKGAYLEYVDKDGNLINLDLGTIEAISNSITKRVSVTPIVTRPMADAFPVETGNSQSLSITFKRKHPGMTSYDDQPGTSVGITSMWSNERWYSELTAAIDRWQARTDGFILHYVDSGSGYLPSFDIGCYIKSIDRIYKNDFNELISGSINFSIGSMYVNTRDETPPASAPSFDSMDVLMSDTTGDHWYVLYAGSEHNCISKIEITGGSESPFEFAIIHISKKKLMDFAPDLAVKGNIVNGKNLIRMSLMGEHSMYVTQVQHGDTIKIKAYCLAWAYKSANLTTPISGSALDIISGIIFSPEYGVTFERSFVKWYRSDFDKSTIYIPQGTNVWRTLQICAMVMGCKLWFADDKAYLIDYRRIGTNDDIKDFGDLVLFGNVDPIRRRCIGKSKIDDEGIDPLANYVTIECKSAMDSVVYTSYPYPYTESINTFGKKSAGTLTLPELIQQGDDVENAIEQGRAFAENYLSYYGEPQRSVTFTMKEAFHRRGNNSPQ